MTASGSKIQKRKNSPARGDGGHDKDMRRIEQHRPRSDIDRRSKVSHERPSPSRGHGKGKGRERTPSLKKSKSVDINNPESVAEEVDDSDPEWSGEDELPEEEEGSESSDGSLSGSDPSHQGRQARDKVMKKPVTLDINGVPWGSMKECLSDDIKKYAKSLDPTANWESQPSPLRSHLFKRLYKDWEMLGQSFKVSEKWVGPIVTKVLITTRWRLNTLIDAGQPKPADVTQEQWNVLLRRRNTEDSQILSEHMRSISQGKGSKLAQLKAIERDAIVKLALQHNRKPYQTEITDEVAREYTRQQLEKRKAALQKGADMDEVRSRVVDMEESMSRFEGKVGDSQQRLEEMLKAFITSHTAGSSNAMPNSVTPTPRSSPVPEQPGMGSSHGRIPRLGSAIFVNISMTEKDVVGADGVVDGAGSARKEVSSPDVQVEDFLKGLLQEHDDVLGLLDGVKSADTGVLSGRSEDIQNKVGDAIDDRLQGSPSCEPKDDGAVDSAIRSRRNAGFSQQTRSLSSVGAVKVPKTSTTKVGGPSRAPMVATKSVSTKKVDPLKKK